MYISIDVGGTNTRVSLSTELDKPRFEDSTVRRINTHNFEEDLDFIVKAAKELSTDQDIHAVGIGVPGDVNSEKTGLTVAENLAAWVDYSIVEYLSERLNCQVYLDNDAVAMGLGEAYYGGLKEDFDCIVWGTGIGGAAVRYAEGLPEVTDLNWETRFKDWEHQNGGSRLADIYGRSTMEFTETDWVSVSENFKTHLSDYVEKYQPNIIVMGGGLAVLHQEMLESFGADIGVTILVTKFADDGGIVGGFGLIKRGLQARG